MKIVFVLSLCTLLALSGGCVLRKRFRYVENQPNCFAGTDPDPGNPKEMSKKFHSLDCRTPYYKLGVIEYFEDGRHVDPLQETKVLDLIEREKSAAPGHKVITLVYVHGWKNNASQADPGSPARDFERFESALSNLGAQARHPNGKPGVPIVGVYIGWRGKSLTGPEWITFLSYWGRRNAANRVGGTELGKTLNAIIDRTNMGSNLSRVILLGHSFGARVLERAIETHQVKLYERERGKDFVTPRVDLVLYVNSANDSRLTLRRVDDLHNEPIAVRHPDYDPAKCAGGSKDRICREYPLMVAISSTGDWATKWLLPAADTVNRDKDPAIDPTTQIRDEYLDKPPTPLVIERTAAAHTTFFHSHDVIEIPCPRERPPECDPKDDNCAFAFKTVHESNTCYKADVRTSPKQKDGTPGKPVFNNTAFWIMSVDPPVIKDHGDIWNLSFLNMLSALMQPRGFFEASTGRVQLRLDGASK